MTMNGLRSEEERANAWSRMARASEHVCYALAGMGLGFLIAKYGVTWYASSPRRKQEETAPRAQSIFTQGPAGTTTLPRPPTRWRGARRGATPTWISQQFSRTF